MPLYEPLLDYVFKFCKLICYSYFCACLWCFLWSLTLILPQRWEPISPQQRYGTSIVEVYRIVEEVFPSIILSALIFWSLLFFWWVLYSVPFAESQLVILIQAVNIRNCYASIIRHCCLGGFVALIGALNYTDDNLWMI